MVVPEIVTYYLLVLTILTSTYIIYFRYINAYNIIHIHIIQQDMTC